jgi:hypothetical protein
MWPKTSLVGCRYDRKLGPRAGRMVDCELDPSASACRRFAFFIRAE